MIKKKVAGLISICHKAGYLILGADNIKGYTKKVYVILMDKQSGKNLKKIAYFLQNDTGAELFELDNLQDYTNIQGCKLLAIKNKGLAEHIQNLLKEQ